MCNLSYMRIFKKYIINRVEFNHIELLIFFLLVKWKKNKFWIEIYLETTKKNSKHHYWDCEFKQSKYKNNNNNNSWPYH